MSYLEKYHFWLENEYFDEPAKAELRALAGNKEEIKDRFYKDLEFGTGGLRGKIAMGTNRMNIYTVSRTTEGLANYLLEESPKDPTPYTHKTILTEVWLSLMTVGINLENLLKLSPWS